jgi:PST family polysaccharide transporter
MSLRLRIRSSLVWVAVSSGMRFCLQLGLSVVLARLLSPADFGRMGMIAGAFAIFAPLATCSLQDAVISGGDESPERLSSLFWLGTLLGLGATAVFVLAAPLLALYYQDPQIEPLVRVMAATFAFAGIAAVPEGLMRKRMAFNSIARVEISIGVVSSLIAVVAAWRGAGVWSLVVQLIAQSVLACAAWIITSGLRPRLVWHKPIVRAGLRFGSALSLAEIVSLISTLSYTFIIGRFMGAAALGFYSRGLGLPQLLQSQIGALASSITLPALASIEDTARVRSATLQTLAATSLITAPIAGGLATCGDLVVSVLYGQEWAAAAAPLRVLALATFINAALFPLAALYRTRNRPDLLLRIAVAAAILSVGSVLAGALFGGLLLIAWLQLARSVVLSIPHIILGGGLVQLRIADFLRAIASPVSCAAAMAVAVLGVRQLLALPAPIELLCSAAIGAAVYVGLAFSLRIEPLQNVLRLLREPST